MDTSPLALSEAQREIWLAHLSQPESPRYNIGEYIEISGPIDVALFEMALHQVIQEAECLWIRCLEGNDGPVQTLVEPTWTMPFLDLKGESDPLAAAKKWMWADLVKPLDLQGDTLFQFALIQIAADHFCWYQRFHHIINDGTGGSLIARRVAEIYTALAAGEMPQQHSFGSLASLLEEQAAYRRSRHFESDHQYWADRLNRFPESLSLSSRLKYSMEETARQAADNPTVSLGFVRHTLELPSELTREMRGIASTAGISWPQLITALITAYTHRLTGATQLLPGIAVTARLGVISRNVPGMAANVLPLPLTLSSPVSIASLLEQVTTEMRKGLRHQRYRSEAMRRCVDARQWLFTPVINMMPFDYKLDFAGNSTATHNLSAGPVEDLSVLIYDRGNDQGIRIDFDGNIARYNEDELAELSTRFLMFIESLVENVAQPINQIALLTREERHKLLRSWDKPANIKPLIIPDIFESQVVMSPDAVALISQKETYTYREMNEWANTLAHLLIDRGIGPDDIVGISLPRGASFIAVMLAVLKAGAAYLPLDPHYPLERLALMINDAKPAILIVADELDLPLSEETIKLQLDEIDSREILSRYSGRNPLDDERRSPLRVNHLAYVIYTSGSTGMPKGVMLTHEGIVGLATAQIERFTLTPASRILQLASSSFDASVMEILMAFASGASLVIPDAAPLAGTALANVLADYQITHALIPPTLLASIPKIELPHLRTLIVGGEACPADLVERWSHGRDMVNAYGPTEVTACVTMSDPLASGEVPPIGRPIDNTNIYLLDTNLELLPPGRVGELYIASEGVARGYLDRPELTSERFVADPYGAPGSRMYRTGDLARWKSDGVLEYAGRVDQQVKLRGLRIELGEIEESLLQYPYVEQAAVAVRDDVAGQKRLVGYVVCAAGESLEVSSLRSFLMQKLPAHMVPEIFMQMDSLPMTPGGKLNRSALPAVEIRQTDRILAEPRNTRERDLCMLFRELLHTDSVGIHDNFFELGGDSILSIQLVSRARAAGLFFTHRDVFKNPTVDGLAFIAQTAIAISQEPIDDGVGVVQSTPITRWLLDQEVSSRYFSQSLLLQVPIQLTEEQLLLSLQSLLDHHASLRMKVVTSIEGKRKLEVQPAGTVQASSCLRKVDISSFDADAFSRCHFIEANDARLRLSPDAGVMVQFVWFTSKDELTSRLLIVAHHLAVDGVSWRILISDLAEFAAVAVKGEEILFPTRSLSFRRYAQLLNEEASRPERESELPDWISRLTEPSVMILEEALDSSIDTAATAQHLSISMPRELVVPLLGAVGAAFHASINDILLAGFTLALLVWERRQKGRSASAVLFDLEGHGRHQIKDDVDLSSTVGWFTSIAPVRVQVGSLDLDDVMACGGAIDQVLKSIKEQLRAIPDQGLGYGMLRYLNEDTAPRLAALATPQIAFNYLGRFTTTDKHGWGPAPGMDALRADFDPAMPMAHAIEVDSYSVETSGGPEFVARWRWAPRFLTETSVRMLAELWFHMLEVLVRRSALTSSAGFISSDFPLVKLTQREIEHLERQHPHLEEVLTLSPTQEGLLFHALYDGANSDVYTVQLTIGLSGLLNESNLRNAVTELVQRHEALRANFVYEDLSQAVQCISNSVAIPWRTADLSSYEEAEREAQLQILVSHEYSGCFDVTKPPLLRFLLVRLTSTEHRLVFTHHHLLLDGWSMAVILRDLRQLYAPDGSAKLARVTPYREYLGWLQKRDHDSAEQAWKTELMGLGEPTRLAKNTSSMDSQMPQEKIFDLSAVLSDKLVKLSRENGITLNTVMQGAWAILLSKLTGNNDVVFGVTLSGRPPEISGIEGMVGLFITTLPFRAQLDPADTITGFLSALQDHGSRIMSYEPITLAEIQRIAGQGDLFDTLVVFENYPVPEDSSRASITSLNISGLEWRDATHYPLSLTVIPGPIIRFRLQYQAGIFESHRISSIAEYFIHLLDQIVEDGHQSVGQLMLAGPEMQRQLLDTWNDTAHVFSNKTLPDLFEDRVGTHPDAIALIYEEASLSYRELNEQANRLAYQLQIRGVGPECFVGVSMFRSMEMVISLLAVVKSGAAYLPLDPDYPVERIAFMTEDAQPVLVLDKDLYAELMAEEVEAAYFPGKNPDRNSGETRLDANHPAYVIYTSGSTGRPKGVIVSHRAIVNRLQWMQSEYKLQPDDRILQKTPFGFDVSVWEFFWPLLEGTTLVIAPPGTHRDPAHLAALIRKQRVTVAHFVPSMLDAFLTEPTASQCSGLRCVVCSGEALSAELSERFHSILNSPLHNLYGPTEAAVDVSFWECTPSDDSHSVPIGRPVWNTQLYVLDSGLNPCPVGVPGELYLAGVQLARGYLNRSALTAERFVANPHGEPGSRMYRTGDIARWREDGALEYLGRTDNQVKIRGLRIELGEIEAQILSYPGIAQAAVLARTTKSGDKRLVAYLVLEDTTRAPEISLLKQSLSRDLPEYMVPAEYVLLEKMPLSPNGKLDRNALPEPESNFDAILANFRAPRNPQEEMLCSLFGEMLDLPKVGIDDNFFELGGHSLIAVRLISRIHSILGIQMSIRTLFEAPTVAKLVDQLGSSATHDPLDVVLPLRSSGERPPIFCIHPIGGLSWSYAGLMPHLSSQHPLYGLQARGIGNRVPMPETLFAMAADYVAQMRSIQPKGPYHILGWSFGGLVAFAAATLLQDIGEEIGLLSLLDTYPHTQEKQKEIRELREVLAIIFEDLGYDLGDEEPEFSKLKERLQRDGSVLSIFEEHHLRSMVDVFWNNDRIARHFSPRKYNGDVLFFAATRDRGPEWPLPESWAPYVTGDIKVYPIDCGHRQMTEAVPLSVIGSVISSQLERKAEYERSTYAQSV